VGRIYVKDAVNNDFVAAFVDRIRRIRQLRYHPEEGRWTLA
jgi:hypothetical protein